MNNPKTELCERCLKMFVAYEVTECPWCQLEEAHADILRLKHSLAVEGRDWIKVDSLRKEAQKKGIKI